MNTAAPSIDPHQPAITLPPAPNFQKSLFRTLGWATLVCMLVWGWIAVDMRPAELATGGDKMYEMVFGGVTARGQEKRIPPQLVVRHGHVWQLGNLGSLRP